MIKFGVEGWFTVEALKGGSPIRVRKFKNLITDWGLDGLGGLSSANLYRGCLVGTGTTPPTYTDSQMSNFLAGLSTSFPTGGSGVSPAPEYYSWRDFTWTSAIGALGNNNLTEVGISGSFNEDKDLFSRQLILDSGGNPVAFPIKDDEQLRVTYQLRFYPPLTDSLSTINIGSASYDTITRALWVTGSNAWGVAPASGGGAGLNFQSISGVDAYSGDIRSITDITPAGSLLGNATHSTLPYVSGSHYSDIRGQFPTGQGNGDIRSSVFILRCCRFQVQYDPPIPKSNNEILTLNQRISWARR